jgi:hypothetical protein
MVAPNREISSHNKAQKNKQKGKGNGQAKEKKLAKMTSKGSGRRVFMGLPPRPVLGAAPPQGSGVPRRFQKRPLLPPSTEGMCVPALTQLMDCYSALGLDGMQEPGACFAERLDLINCQKREVRPFRSIHFD